MDQSTVTLGSLDKVPKDILIRDKMNISKVILDNNEEVKAIEDNIRKSTIVLNSKEKMEQLMMRCSVCEENFSEDRVPRNLLCGHSMCSPCVNLCLSDGKFCPECHEKQLVKSASDLPINYPLLRLIRSIINVEFDLKNKIVPVFPVDIPESDSYPDAEKCPTHDCSMTLMCMSCSMWVCRNCLVVDHPNLPRGSCIVLNITDAMVKIKKEFNRNVNLYLKDIEYVKNNLEPEMIRHSYCLKYCPHDLKVHCHLINEVEKEFNQLKKQDDSTADLAMECMKKCSEKGNRTTSPGEITTTCKELSDCQKAIKEYIAEEKMRKASVSQNILSHWRMDLRLLVEKKVPVYAQFEGGKQGTRWSLITCKDDRLLLYSLEDERPSSEAIIIPYAYARDLVPRDNSMVFFEVGTTDKILGRVYVRLFGVSRATTQALLMCSGEKGPCYKNTCFYKYDDKGKLLSGGDYENNDGSGGQAFLHEYDDLHWSGFYNMAAGALVIDDWNSTRFTFLLFRKVNFVCNAIGKVTEGLHILKAASKIKPITDSLIRKCGFLIPMNIKDTSS